MSARNVVSIIRHYGARSAPLPAQSQSEYHNLNPENMQSRQSKSKGWIGFAEHYAPILIVVSSANESSAHYQKVSCKGRLFVLVCWCECVRVVSVCFEGGVPAGISGHTITMSTMQLGLNTVSHGMRDAIQCNGVPG
jgi:hypothetical protein